MALTLDDISALFDIQGGARYGGEAISQRQHALQCAHLAEQAGASAELVAAALLHDLGHLVAPGDAAEPARAAAVDDLHQFLAVPFLRGVFSEAVLAPIRLHVDAKRYLCQADRHYGASLSAASRRSLALQGGPFSSAQAKAFIAQAFATDALALRRWDDRAKDPAARPPGWAHYRAILESVRCPVGTQSPVR